ncbi:MAG: branched-chain amino acid transaminase [bacterium]
MNGKLERPQYAYFQGKIVPFGEAKISIRTHAFNYGTGVFEGIRGYWNGDERQLYVFHMDAHYKRLLNSCKVLMSDIKMGVEELGRITLELLRKEHYEEDVYIRPIVYKSGLQLGPRLHDIESDLCIYTMPLGDYIDTEKGVRVKVSSWRRIDDNMISARAKVTGVYVNSALARTEANLAGVDEAIVLTADGHVSEGSAENIFIVRDGMVITPPVSDNILEGITRNTLIQIMRDELGIETIERSIDRSELYIADEVFFCGTGAQVSPVIEIDNRPVGNGEPGPFTKRLAELYFSIVKARVEKYRSWCTPVYT